MLCGETLKSASLGFQGHQSFATTDGGKVGEQIEPCRMWKDLTIEEIQLKSYPCFQWSWLENRVAELHSILLRKSWCRRVFCPVTANKTMWKLKKECCLGICIGGYSAKTQVVQITVHNIKQRKLWEQKLALHMLGISKRFTVLFVMHCAKLYVCQTHRHTHLC